MRIRDAPQIIGFVMRLGKTEGAWDRDSQPSSDSGSAAVAQRSVAAPLGLAFVVAAGVVVGADEPQAAVASTRASRIASDRGRDMSRSVAGTAFIRRRGARMLVS
jgi:hypothetical protein